MHNFFADPSQEWIDWLCESNCPGGVKLKVDKVLVMTENQ